MNYFHDFSSLFSENWWKSVKESLENETVENETVIDITFEEITD